MSELVKKTRVTVTTVGSDIVTQNVQPKEIRIGTHVISIAKETGYGEGSQLKVARENQLVGKVISTMGTTSCVIQFPPFMGAIAFNVTVSNKNLKVLEPSQALLLIKELESKSKKLLNDRVESIKSKISTKRIPIMERRDYDLTTKLYLNSNFNYVMVGNLPAGVTPGTDINYSNFVHHYEAQCCSLTKTPSDLIVHIPKDWLNYYGYTVIDLKAWLSFLQKCDINFKGFYNKKVIMNEVYRNTKTHMPLYEKSNLFMYPEMEAYEIILPTTDKRMTNYMNFITVRYMYNLAYFSIPFTAMQLKRGLGEKATFWECILLAHTVETYGGYYCWISNAYDRGGVGSSNLALPTKANNQKRIISVLSTDSGSGMNSSFSYSTGATIRNWFKDNLHLADIRSLIRKQDFENISLFLEQCRKS